MRILMISGHDFWGYPKLATSLPLTLRAIGDCGWHVDFITHEKPEYIDDASRIYGEPPNYIREGIDIHRISLPFNRWIWDIMGKSRMTSSVRQRIRMELLLPFLLVRYGERFAKKADVIYGYEIYGVLAAAKLARRHRKPLITRFQGTFALDWLNASEESLMGRINYYRYWVHWKALRTEADLIIMTDDGTQGIEVLRKLGNTSPVRFWRNGLDVMPSGLSREELRSEMGLPLDALISISVSRLASWKRIDRIISAMPLVVNSIPDYLHIIVGDGECRTRLEQQAKRMGVEEHTIFLGSQPHYKALRYTEASDIFLSLFDSTNIGNPTQEALRLGKPIIALNTGDTDKLITNRVNGILLQNDTREEIASAIIELLLDSKLSEELAMGALCTGRTIWTWQERLEAELTEIEELRRNTHAFNGE